MKNLIEHKGHRLVRSSPSASIPTFDPPAKAKATETALDRLIRLDSWVRPGLSETEFRALFAKCKCGLITTRRVFTDHTCIQVALPSVVIDLTGSGSLEPEVGGMVIDLTSDSEDGM